MFRWILLLCLFLLIAPPLAAQPAQKDEPVIMPEGEFKTRLAELGRLYKLDSASIAEYDKILTYDREVYLGKIHNITFSEVRYTCPPNNALNALSKSKISQILYADGRREVFIPLDDRTVKQKELVDTTRIIIKNQRDWLKVMVTEDPADVANLAAKGNMKVTYEAYLGNADNEELMRQAGNLLKKKAAVLQAHCVLIETKFFHKAYGDLPRVEVTARAFGY
jgi:hypothetical protein